MQSIHRLVWIAVAALSYIMTATAMFGQQAFTCTANAGAPVIVRVEGITEMVGDLVLQCRGGNPTPAGQQVPVTNLRVTLNTNVTSRLLGSGFTDALAIIDDPFPNDSAAPQNTHPGPGDANSFVNGGTVGNINVPLNSPFQTLCATRNGNAPAPGDCNYVVGTYTGANNTARGFASSPYVVPNPVYASATKTASTVYEAQLAGATAVEWEGLPFDAPGPTGTRTLRLTNIRANASMLGLSSSLIPTQVVAFVSVTGAQFFTIDTPQQTVGYIQQGLIASVTANNLQQSENLNTGSGVGGNIIGAGNTIIPVSRVVVTEGYAQAFKPRQFSPDKRISGAGGVGTPGGPLGALSSFYNIAPQNVPGYAYNTEAGFEPTATDGSTYLNAGIGTANFGSRFLLRFANVGSGANVILPGVVPLTQAQSNLPSNPNPPSSVGGWTGGYLVLAGSSDMNGNISAPTNVVTGVNSFACGGPFFSTCPFNGPGAVAPFTTAYSLTPAFGFIFAVYEVVNADPSATETASISIGVSFVSNPTSNLPMPGPAIANVSFAPLSIDSAASSSGTVPRFIDRSSAVDAFVITTLLGIAINHTGNFTQGQHNATYQVTVSNTGVSGRTSGTVTVTESVPTGLALVSMQGNGWTCPGTAANNCTRSDALNAGASYPAITVTVNVASNASSPQVNTVLVSGGGSSPANATDLTNITTGPAVLSIAKTHIGDFVRGEQNATYQVVVSNSNGVGTAFGATVTEIVPSGLMLVAMSGDGWWCPGTAANNCTRGDMLYPGESYPSITVTVNVAANATSPQVNAVSVSAFGAASAATTDLTISTMAHREVWVSSPSLPVAWSTLALDKTRPAHSDRRSSAPTPAAISPSFRATVDSPTPRRPIQRT